MAVTLLRFLSIAMWLRLLVILIFSVSAAISLYSIIKTRGNYHLVGVIIWCLNVVCFTAVAGLCSYGVIHITVDVLNIWSSVVRLHGGIVILTISIYNLSRRLP